MTKNRVSRQMRVAHASATIGERSWRSLLEQIPEVVMVLDRGGAILFINRTVPGLTKEEVIGTSSFDYLPQEHHDTLRTALERVFDSGELHRYEVAGTAPFGGTSYYIGSIGPITQDDRVVAAAVVATDISERKRAEEALRESEERFRGIFESAFDGIVIHENGVILAANPAFEEMYGYRLSDLVGMPILHLTANESRDLVKEKFRSAAQEVYEAVALRKDGTTFRAEVLGKEHTYKGRHVRVVSVRDITERKRAEEALRESEERYRDLYDEAPVAYFSVGLDARIRIANRRAVELLGYGPNQLVGRPVFDLYADTPTGKAKAQQVFERFRCGEEIDGEELEMRREDGTHVWISLTVNAVRDVHGQAVESRSVVRDITQRRQAEEALRESEERYRDLAENLNDAIFEFDTRGRVTYVSPGMEELSGYRPSEVRGRSYIDLIYPDDLSGVSDRVRQRPFGDREPSEYRLLCKSGEARWVRSLGRPVFEGDHVIAFRGVLTDITEGKLAEEALRDSEERYRRLVELSPYGLLVHSEEKVVFANMTAADILGATDPDELIGRPLWGFVHPEHVRAVRKRIKSTRPEGKKVDTVEERLIRLDGQTIDVEMAAVPITYGGKPARHVILKDVSERRRMEAMLQKTREEIEGRVERRMQHRSEYGLTFRELTVLHLVAAGRSDREIATVLDISTRTAQAHVSNILDKMQASSRTEAGVRALREGLIG